MTNRDGIPTYMELRDPAKKVLKKYESGIGPHGEVSEVKIRPHQFQERMAAYRNRAAYREGFSIDEFKDPPPGPEKPQQQPHYARGLLGWLQRLVAGRMIEKLRRRETDWWGMSKAASDLRMEMLRDFAILQAELDHQHKIAVGRDAEAFDSARRNSILRKRVTELEAMVADYEKMIEVIEGLAELEESKDEDGDPLESPEFKEAIKEVTKPTGDPTSVTIKGDIPEGVTVTQ